MLVTGVWGNIVKTVFPEKTPAFRINRLPVCSFHLGLSVSRLLNRIKQLKGRKMQGGWELIFPSVLSLPPHFMRQPSWHTY